MAFVAFAAWADPAPLLYDSPSSLVTSSRLQALAGASVGLAENSESIPFNYAAVAQRAANRARGFDFDLTAAIQLLPFDGLRNIDNEPSSPQIKEPVESQFGGFIQFKRFGLGAYARLSRRNICVSTCDNALTATTAQGAIVFGFNLLQDQLVFGVGLHISSATFDPHTTPPTPLSYTGFALGGGSLFRPHFFPMRFGMSFITAANGSLSAGTVTDPMIVGRVPFSGVVTPAHLSIGASARFGEGAWRFNRMSTSALHELPEDFNAAAVPHDLEPDDPRPPGRFLVTAQLDVILPVTGATTLTQYVMSSMPLPAGTSWTVVPRLGAEVEIVDHLLRLRAGTYIEPAFIATARPRGHGTGGFEVFLGHLLFDWSVSASVDGAPGFFSAAFGLGWWS